MRRDLSDGRQPRRPWRRVQTCAGGRWCGSRGGEHVAHAQAEVASGAAADLCLVVEEGVAWGVTASRCRSRTGRRSRAAGAPIDLGVERGWAVPRSVAAAGWASEGGERWAERGRAGGRAAWGGALSPQVGESDDDFLTITMTM